MGYKVNSPIKQVWLPLSYEWLNHIGTKSFKDFAVAYKKEYGIDLHDLFDLKQSEDGYYINIKGNYLISTYVAGQSLDGYVNTKMVNAFGISQYSRKKQQESSDVLMSITIRSTDSAELEFAHGFSILVPATGTEVNSINDLLVGIYEL